MVIAISINNYINTFQNSREEQKRNRLYSKGQAKKIIIKKDKVKPNKPNIPMHVSGSSALVKNKILSPFMPSVPLLEW